MRRIILLITVLFSTLFFSEKAFGTHVAGGDINVEHVSGNVFDIELNLYADCAGNPSAIAGLDNNRNIGVIGSCFLNTTATVSVVNPGGTEVSQVCPSAINNTTCNSGSLPGLLRFTYTGTITVPSTACNVTFRYALANRNTTVYR
jgi:hypothetical protein